MEVIPKQAFEQTRIVSLSRRLNVNVRNMPLTVFARDEGT